MFNSHVLITLLAITMSAYFGLVDFMRRDFVLKNMAKLGIPERLLPVLGSLKAAGAAGLVLGLAGVPWIGTAAAAGLVLFFTGAIVTHFRALDWSIAFPAGCLLLAIGALLVNFGG